MKKTCLFALFCKFSVYNKMYRGTEVPDPLTKWRGTEVPDPINKVEGTEVPDPFNKVESLMIREEKVYDR